MVLIDSDVFVIDQRFPHDPRFGTNKQFLDRMTTSRIPHGMTVQALLELVGIMSFGTSKNRIQRLPQRIRTMYQLSIVPDFIAHPEYAGCTVVEIIQQMKNKMSLGDAVQAIQISKFAPTPSKLVTWNAKHFQ